MNTHAPGIDGAPLGDDGPWELGLTGPVDVEKTSPARATPEPPCPRYSADFYTQTVNPLMPSMVAVARRILGDDVQAWDAVQEALIRLWNKGDVPPNPRAWLIRAVVLRSLHLARCRARRRQHEMLACYRRPEASRGDDPSGRMEFEELSCALNETLGSIAPENRDVLLLWMAEDMDYAGIAETLRIPIGTVRSRLNRTRRAFREALRAKMSAENDRGGPVDDRR